jgi:hypothetical protein
VLLPRPSPDVGGFLLQVNATWNRMEPQTAASNFAECL